VKAPEPHIRIGQREIGPGRPVYVVAEMSANHGQDLHQARQLLCFARDAGADAVKLQTYDPDRLTLDCDDPRFRVRGGTPWDGRTLHELYRQACTPREWHADLFAAARGLGLLVFSTPFDESAVEFLEGLDAPAYKIASFELVDLPLIRCAARTGKPLILSTGMATLEEISAAVSAARQAGASQIALLKCTSAYPSPPAQMHLRTLQDLARNFDVPVGLSDHTLSPTAAVTAVALGACLIEKHLTWSRAAPGPDSAFSLEPQEFRTLVRAVREAEAALGTVQYGPTPSETPSRSFRRSLFVVRSMRAGEVFDATNVRSIRPADGLPPSHYEQVLGRKAARAIPVGTPLSWELID
jgi:pseudaminic acid synthase